ncbi:hypothetical protein ACUV84_032112 [Puccinellia chinampoensis]
MSGRRPRSRHALGTAAEDRSKSIPPYALRSLASRGGSAAAEGHSRSLADLWRLRSWPPLQSTRDNAVRLHLQTLVGPSPYSQRCDAVPVSKAKLVAAAIEAEAFAAVSESASGATLASDVQRFDVHRTYCKENCLRLHEFFKSRAAASGDLSAATALPLAASASSSEE